MRRPFVFAAAVATFSSASVQWDVYDPDGKKSGTVSFSISNTYPKGELYRLEAGPLVILKP